MLQSIISAGPPLQGQPSWNSSKPGGNEEVKESFTQTLNQSMSAKDDRPKTDRGGAKSPDKIAKAVDNPERKVSSQDDKGDVSDAKPMKAPVANPLEKKAALLRQKAIQKFMDSFESEFDVAPTRLVEAMAQLPPEQLIQNPEETVDSVLAQLDLSEDQKDQAKEMYLTLIVDLGRIDKASQPPVLVMADANMMAGNQIKERAFVGQERKVLLNESLEKMNNKFWMKAEPSNIASNPKVAMEVENPMSMDPWAKQELATDYSDQTFSNEAVDIPGLEQGPKLGPVESKAQAAQKELAEILSQSEDGKPVNMQEVMAQLKNLSHEQNQVPMASEPSSVPVSFQGKDEMVGIKADRDAQAMMAEGQSSNVVMAKQGSQSNPQGEGFSGKGFSEKGLDKESAKESSGKSVKANGLEAMKTPDSLIASPLPKAEPLNGSAPLATAATVPTAGDSNHDASIRQIMNQAQYLIKKGGGEMKVEMSPEGLGQVQMKVIVHDGKVNLQMAADTKEAKQMIESGMSDLKNSLASHKLSVDHVKIDVVANTNTDNSAQNSSNFNSQQRDSTRQFWNQFQQSFGNQSQRDGLTGFSDLKGYGAKKRDPLQPVESEGVARRRTVEGRGSSIDLVA